jgi:26S proteasome regulatory subunit RPN5 C-terminal domain
MTVNNAITDTAISHMFTYACLYILLLLKPKPSEEVLSSWNSDLGALLNLVEHTTHLIHKETMLAGNVKA